MSRPNRLLRLCLEGVRLRAGARSAWLFAAPPEGATTPLLLHSGSRPGPTEWLPHEAALRRLCLEGAGSGDGDPIEPITTPWSHCRVLRLHPERAGLLLGGGEQAASVRSRRRADRSAGGTDPFPPVLFGLCSAPGTTPPPWLKPAADGASRSAEDEAERWRLLLVGALAAQLQQITAVFNDPVSGLPGRSELLAGVELALEVARSNARSLSVLLINPDEFALVNEKYGAAAGDSVLRELAQRLVAIQRSTDIVARYGGAIFSSVMPDAGLAEGMQVAEKVRGRLSEEPFLGGSLRLGFSIGVGTFTPGEPVTALDLIRRSDQALFAAKRSGGSCVAAWEERWEAQEAGNQDRLAGIFTGNISKDYRNMAVLLDTVGAIAASPDFPGLAGQVVGNISSTFRPLHAAIFIRDDQGELSLLCQRTRRPGTSGSAPALEVDDELMALLARAGTEGPPVSDIVPGPGGGLLRCAVPLATGEVSHGCLYLDGPVEFFSVDASDLGFLGMLASQLALARDRANLAEQERLRQEAERRRLQDELTLLRRALQESKLVYRSPEMEATLGIARRVAPTDATVLIIGESGTGKELFARTIHEASPRRKGPLVVVDCGAIPTSLIETELFGHEKGAYTGALQHKRGRLAEAGGGTVLLDEISELPLEVQSKLLRFVQEKQLTPVGGRRAQPVDARVVAASNRDLAQEVAAGRFRADLYHRLNVVRIVVPPLRERRDDILLLAEHFVELYTLLYRKSVRSLTPEAEALLMQYPWPGNVRELQNRIMQAVILCEGSELGAGELRLPVSEAEAAPIAAGPSVTTPASDAPVAPVLRERGSSLPAAAVDPWEVLREAVSRQIERATSSETGGPPLGRWLSDDLLLEADAASSGVLRGGARSVGMPVSTFRRRLRQAATRVDNGMAPRPPGWQEVRAALGTLVRASDGAEELDQRTQRMLLEEVLRRGPAQAQRRAAILGVTLPTYRRRLEAAGE